MAIEQLFRVADPQGGDITVAVIDETKARLQTHEEVCVLRYDGICGRLKRLETVGLYVAGFVISMLVTIILKLG